jgi:hypothetical protein
MTCSKWFLHRDRTLEVRDKRVLTTLEIWIYENGRPVGLHSTVPLAEASRSLAVGVDLLGRAMERAVQDVQHGRFSLAPFQPTALVAV